MNPGAHIVDRQHIGYLAGAALAGGPLDYEHPPGQRRHIDPADPAAAVRLGQILWDENIRAVQGPAAIGARRHILRPADVWPHTLDYAPAQILKSVDCLVYQCDGPDWPGTEAHAIAHAIRAAAVARLIDAAGYQRAAWGAPVKPGRRRIIGTTGRAESRLTAGLENR